MKPRRRSFLTRRRRRQQYSGSSYYDPWLDLLVVADGPENTAIMHELMHFLDHVGTSYGWLLDEIVTCTARGWGQLLQRCRETSSYMPVPLDRLLAGANRVEKIKPRGRPQKEVMERAAVGAICHDLLAGLMAAMQGDPPKMKMKMRVPPAAGLAVIERMMQSGETLPESPDGLKELSSWQTPESLFPEYGWGLQVADRRIGIGARALLEGRAMIVESALVKDNVEHFSRALRLGAPEYVVAVSVVAEHVAELGKHAESFGYSTFLALSDLALMTPASPTFERFRRERAWRDVHPGYRFDQLVGLIPKVGHYDRKGDPFDYQAKFCRLLSWPDPRQVLEEGLRFKGGDYRSVRRKELFRLKLKSPELFAVGRITEDAKPLVDLITRYEPLHCVRVGQRALQAINEIDRANLEFLLQRLGQTYLFDLGERLMECEHPLEVAVDWIEAYEDRVDFGKHRSLRLFLDDLYAAGVKFGSLLNGS